jgi:outer membrane protein OmpA-like peptidoglycan-associated protein
MLTFVNGHFAMAKSDTKESTKKADAAKAGKDQFQENLLSLRGLKGVYVVLDFVVTSSKSNHVDIPADLQKQIQHKLETAGLKLLSEEDMLKTAGQPRLDIFPSYSLHLAKAAGVIIPPTQSVPLASGCCYSNIWGSFSQSAQLSRDLGGQYRLSTWGSGSNTYSCDDLGKWMSEAVLKVIDSFVADVNKAKTMTPVGQPVATTKPANKSKESDTPSKSATTAKPVNNSKESDTSAKSATEAEPKQVEISKSENTTVKEAKNLVNKDPLKCDMPVVIYAELFKSGSNTLKNSQKLILNKVAEMMVSCKQYKYQIETHVGNQKSSYKNDLLSAGRALSVRDYLMTHGVVDEQINLHFYGKRKLTDSEETNEKSDYVYIYPLVK